MPNLGLQVVRVNLFKPLSWGNISKPLLVPAPIRGTASGFPHMPDSFRARFFGDKVPPKGWKSLGGSHPVSTPWEPTQDTLLTQKFRHLNCCVPRILTENLLEHHKEELAAPGSIDFWILSLSHLATCHNQLWYGHEFLWSDFRLWAPPENGCQV